MRTLQRFKRQKNITCSNAAKSCCVARNWGCESSPIFNDNRKQNDRIYYWSTNSFCGSFYLRSKRYLVVETLQKRNTNPKYLVFHIALPMETFVRSDKKC